MIKSLKKQNIAIKTITHVVKDPSTSPQAIKKKNETHKSDRYLTATL